MTNNRKKTNKKKNSNNINNNMNDGDVLLWLMMPAILVIDVMIMAANGEVSRNYETI